MAARGPVLLIPASDKKHRYVGPVKFMGRCENCGHARNRHCGRCKGCPGYHVQECMTGHATGAWH